MPNTIGPTGIKIQSVEEITDELKNGTADYPGMLQIYGPNINVLPNSPDGQMLGIVAQAKRDVLEFIAQVFASFDPDQAMGVVLDQRVVYNGVQRNAGTYTKQPITVAVTRALTIDGLDTDPDNPFTVADAAGNQFVLETAHTFPDAGSYSLPFRAVVLGAVLTSQNTITTVVTITLGIASVNNPDAATSIGLNEETDASLRIRRARSVALPSKGFFDGLYGALLDVTGVLSVNLLENDTDTTDGNGIPSHSIWAIVEGGTDEDVAQAIYVKRNAGCGLKGAVMVNVVQADGGIFVVLFDRPVQELLWISFSVTALPGAIAPDTTFIRLELMKRLRYDIGQPADASAISAIVKELSPTSYVSEEGVSDTNGSYVPLKNPTNVNYQFIPAPGRIVINGAHP